MSNEEREEAGGGENDREGREKIKRERKRGKSQNKNLHSKSIADSACLANRLSFLFERARSTNKEFDELVKSVI